ncbi:MarR family winged helix-turn-helix transcriptional regulator [Hanstruepera ponticola]|uniref:MarR family winged helix-turn-helix transcriptional regulator n=1 Tax=Hanstruepera ponticola TaxID=2042995 RepID=UPI000CF124EC|nr:MarR family winged helix-turn-helix transcriptional regulator [Hanstruepera ponticola]
MSHNPFNPDNQSTNSKIVVALQRISEAFKVLLWDKAKALGLSPIQIQILLFVDNHKDALCNVSHLADEFNVTKPTISDAVRVLNKKGLTQKGLSTSDSRSYSIQLTAAGKDIVTQTEQFANPIQATLHGMGTDSQEALFKTLSDVIYKLNQHGILTVQRTCFGCNYYTKHGSSHFCNLLNKPLLDSEIRLDCPEFESTV